MPRTRPDRDARPLSDLRSDAARIVDEVRKTKRPLILTEHGENQAVLLDLDEYDRLLDELDLLRDIAAAERELDAGGGISHEEAKAAILNRLRS